ncbi:CPBP family intramembrane glutamic endopeptidase [Pseudothermotoga thermarum]|uniref:Abortive infection protein n=1 Tax=Pseudothermotoga thermarum DSM 5069 TaxID=688269 RepID=F7YWN0_9THEM|nr:CPBP family intramembrane glutamic endopeptidase [Pseudothermotoga thermarum]AEH52017.1 Abortive infection protein [Pseudothermotoga thermarum DSM 5069]
MKAIFYLILLLGFVVVQSISSRLKTKYRLLVVGVNQVVFSTILFFLLKVNYGFKVNFAGFWWFLILFLITLFFGWFFKASQAKIPYKLGFEIVVSVGVLMPLSEEIFFRGILLYIYPNSVQNAFVFASLHLLNVFSRLENFSVYNLLYRFAVGYIFSSSVLKTQSLFCPVLCHTVNNLAAVLVLFFSKNVTNERN